MMHNIITTQWACKGTHMRPSAFEIHIYIVICAAYTMLVPAARRPNKLGRIIFPKDLNPPPPRAPQFICIPVGIIRYNNIITSYDAYYR